MKKIILFQILGLITAVLAAQHTPVEKGLLSITPDVIKAQTGFLASDWTEGREAGERGGFISSDYIASMLKLYGVKPGGDYITSRVSAGKGERSYFQNFIILKNEQGSNQVLKVKSNDGLSVRSTGYTRNLDYIIGMSGTNIDIEAPVVFAGYGFKNDALKYNDFSKIDIKGKFILKLSGIPQFAREKLSPAQINAYYSELESFLRSMGAAGIIEFNPRAGVVIRSVAREFNNMAPAETSQFSAWRADFRLPGRKIPERSLRITVSSRIAEEILKGTGISIEDYIARADENKSGTLQTITGKSIHLISDLKSTPISVRNVIGIIEGSDPTQVIVLGAHYDHMGMKNGYIWNGADDNASGTVGVMTIAKAIMETRKKPGKSIVIALWTAEEMGLLGSHYYVDNLPYSVKNLRLNLNFDMISRFITDEEPNKAVMSFSSSCPEFRNLTEENLKKFNIDLDLEYISAKVPPGGSDHLSFVEAGVPVMRFKPGHREEYHTPDDEVSTLDWDIMEKIIRISFANVWELANSNW